MKLDANALKIIETLKSCSNIGENAKEHYENLLERQQKIHKDEDFHKSLQFFKALGNYDRLMILRLLKNSDMCVCELEGALQKSQPAISRHLKILEQVNLIQGWKQGKFTHYSLIKPTFDHILHIWNDWVVSTENWLQNLYSQ